MILSYFWSNLIAFPTGKREREEGRGRYRDNERHREYRENEVALGATIDSES